MRGTWNLFVYLHPNTFIISERNWTEYWPWDLLGFSGDRLTFFQKLFGLQQRHRGGPRHSALRSNPTLKPHDVTPTNLTPPPQHFRPTKKPNTNTNPSLPILTDNDFTGKFLCKYHQKVHPKLVSKTDGIQYVFLFLKSYATFFHSCNRILSGYKFWVQGEIPPIRRNNTKCNIFY